MSLSRRDLISGAVSVLASRSIVHAEAVIHDPLESLQYHLPELGIDRLWNLGIVGDARAPIVVMDTGVDEAHEDLMGNLSPSESAAFFGPHRTDRVGHGTFVAGLAGAVGGNGIGISGVVRRGRMISHKVIDQVYYVGMAAVTGPITGVLAAYEHLLQNFERLSPSGAPIVVINAFSFYEHSPELLEMIRAGEDKFLVVAAAGNGLGFNGPEGYPAGYSLRANNVLSVTAVDRAANLVSNFGNIGPGVDLAVFGTDLVSTFLDGRYAMGSGTSFSAAIAGGLANLFAGELVKLGRIISPSALRRGLIDGAERRFFTPFFSIPVLLDPSRAWERVKAVTRPARMRVAVPQP